jgi:dihydrodipicolinate synthase/N-acetylneuraminate lyase
MNLLGMNAGPLRLPLVTISERNKQELALVVRAYGFPI